MDPRGEEKSPVHRVPYVGPKDAGRYGPAVGNPPPYIV